MMIRIALLVSAMALVYALLLLVAYVLLRMLIQSAEELERARPKGADTLRELWGTCWRTGALTVLVIIVLSPVGRWLGTFFRR